MDKVMSAKKQGAPQASLLSALGIISFFFLSSVAHLTSHSGIIDTLSISMGENCVSHFPIRNSERPSVILCDGSCGRKMTDEHNIQTPPRHRYMVF